MIGQVCAEVKNYFIQPDRDIHAGTFEISGGSIEPLSFLRDGQFYRIVGSYLNDGVYQRGVDDLALVDEEFDGAIWAMRVPRDFVELCKQIQIWEAENAKALSGPYQSESFAGYSYSKGSSASGGAYGWADQFRSKLNAYRRLTVL